MYLMELIENDFLKSDNTWGIDDIDLHSDKCNTDVYIYWNTLSINLKWYPIIQVCNDEGNILIWEEGPENSFFWLDWIEGILKEYCNIDDWWYLGEE